MKKVIFIAAFLCAAVTSAQEALKLNLEVGETYTLKKETTSENKQVVGGMPQNSTTIVTEEMEYIVTGKDGDNYLVDVIPTKMSNETKSSMGSQIMSSDGDMTNPMNQIFKNMTNKVMKLTLSPVGQVIKLDLNGYGDDIMKDVQMDDMQKLQMEGMIKAEMTEDKLKRSYTNAFAYMKDSKVKEGATWNTMTDQDLMGITLKSEATNTIKSMTGEKVVIATDGTMTTGGVQDTMMMGIAAKTDMEGTTQGTTTLDRKSGWITSSENSGTVKGKITIPAGAAGPEEMVVDTEAMTTIVVTGGKKAM